MPALNNEKSANFKVGDSVYLGVKSFPTPPSMGSSNKNSRTVYSIVSVYMGQDGEFHYQLKYYTNPFTATVVKDVTESEIVKKVAEGGRRRVRSRRRSKRRAGTRRRRA